MRALSLIGWVRRLLGIDPEQLDAADLARYAKFERAVSEGDVECYVYDEHIRGQIIVLKGEDLHAVTPQNLVSFRKLNRAERRFLDKNYSAHLARGQPK